MFGSKTLLALILFVLQFNSRGFGLCCNNDDDEIHNCGRNQLIDNSILFIIALYFICCCLNDEKGCGCGRH